MDHDFLSRLPPERRERMRRRVDAQQGELARLHGLVPRSSFERHGCMECERVDLPGHLEKHGVTALRDPEEHVDETPGPPSPGPRW